jgi:hypothetical protein
MSWKSDASAPWVDQDDSCRRRNRRWEEARKEGAGQATLRLRALRLTGFLAEKGLEKARICRE